MSKNYTPEGRLKLTNSIPWPGVVSNRGKTEQKPEKHYRSWTRKQDEVVLTHHQHEAAVILKRTIRAILDRRDKLRRLMKCSQD